MTDKVPGAALHRSLALVIGLTLAGSTAACTGGSPSESASAGASARASRQAAAAPPSVPMRVAVTHVAGKLGAAGRATLAREVRRTLSSYVDAAFLSGTYPRTDFTGSFGAFTAGAVADARRDRATLTNQALGSTTTVVHATHRTAYLSVLAPKTKVAGLTAAVDLVFVVDRGDKPAQRIRLRGRLLMTRDTKGAWAIFGYDLDRSTKTVRSGS